MAAAKTLIDIAMQYKVENLSDILTQLKTVRDTANLAATPKANLTFVIDELEQVIPKAQEMISKGLLDPKKLGLSSIAKNLELTLRSVAASSKEMGVVALKPFQEALTDIQNQRDVVKSDIVELQNQLKATTPDAVKAEFRAKTGVKRVIGGGSEKEAQAELDRLQAIPKDKQDEATKLKIKNQKILVKLYQKAAEESKRIAKEQKALKKQVADLAKAEKKAQEDLTQAEKASVDIKDKTTKSLKEQSEAFNKNRKEAGAVQDQLKDANDKIIDQAKKEKDVQDKLGNSLGNKAAKALSYYVVFNQLKRLFQLSISTVQELDKAMTEAATVTSMNREEAWKLLGTYQDLANSTGLAVSELAGVVNQFLRQGRTIGDALELTRVAAQSAKVAGISAKEAVDFLTSAVNGFGLAAQQAEDVADKFAAIAARSASSFEELAIAMSKVAPTAQSAGVGIDFMMGVLAKGIETTREAPENIGTAFKTIFARMREVTDIGKAAEDGMSLNRVEKALQSVGVTLRDGTGQFRNLEDVLIDVGNQWSTLTSIEQAYIATALAGTRQQPRLLAIFNDFERTKELIQISADATGELAFQHYEYMQGMEAAMTTLKNSWQTFIMTLTDSELVIGIINTLTKVIQMLSGALESISDPAGFTITLIAVLGTTMAISAAKTILATVASIKHSLANLGLIKTTVAATAAQAGYNATLLAVIGPILIVVAIIAALTFGLIAMANSAYTGANANERLANNIRKINSALSDMEKKADSVDKLSQRFTQLQKKTAQTVEDLQEMARIEDELGNYKYTRQAGELKGEEITYNIVSPDFTGQMSFNQFEYDRLMADMEADRRALEQERIENLNKALRLEHGKGVTADFSKVFDDPVFLSTARKLGFDSGVEFISGFSDATDKEKEEIKKSLEQAMKAVDMSIFTGYALQDKTTGEIYGYYETTELAEEAAKDKRDEMNLNSIERFTTNVLHFNQDALEAFTKNLTQIIKGYYTDLNKATTIINNKNISNTEKVGLILKEQVEQYEEASAEALQLLERGLITQEEYDVMIKVIGATFADQKILQTLMNEGYALNLLANLTIQGLSGEEIEQFLEGLEVEVRPYMSSDMVESLNKRILDAVGTALDGDYELGFTNLAKSLRDAGYTPDEIEAELNKLGNIIKNITAQAAGDLMQSQMKTSEKLFQMLENAAKGNFENFAELAQEFGADAITALMGGDETLIVEALKANIAETVDTIQKSIDEIEARASALELIDKELGVADAAELATLIAMRNYYEEIALYTQLRNYRLGQAKSLLDTVNRLLEVQNTLLGAGMESSGFLSFLDDITNRFREIATTTLGTQLVDDLNMLKEFGEMRDGTLIFDPDTINTSQFRAAFDNYMGTLQEYIKVQQSAFEQYKKTVTETYKTEIDAVKNAVSEKWKQIEYADRLAEAEEKVLVGRRNLAALQLSGAGGSELRQAEKDLKKLEQERRKMIEQQMAEEAQKQLEAERDELILAEQQKMVEAIQIYTDQFDFAIQELTNLGLEIPKVSTVIKDSDEKTEKNTEEIIKNTTALQDLNKTLVEMNKPMTGQVARGGGFVDASVFFGI